MAESLYIRNTLSPGDYIVLSAAIRDLHKCYPGKYQTMVDVPQPAIFASNPNITHFAFRPGMRNITASYHRGKWNIHKSNQQPAHFLWGFIGDLNLDLKTDIKLTDFKPDLYLNEEEKKTPLVPKPYWVFVSGGKMDYTAKWWDPAWWQIVASRMGEWTTMVQVGGGSHVHPQLKGVYDLVNKTSFRDLMRLIYHSDGVLCIVTCLMHIAAAFNKPCVVLAGGREAWQWEAYDEKNRLNNMRLGDPKWEPPTNDNFIPHQYLNTMGKLDCCKTAGCWKSKIEPNHSKSCVRPVRQNGRYLPLCMQMIEPDIVLGAVEWYYQKGILTRAKTPSVIVQPRAIVTPVKAVPQPVLNKETGEWIKKTLKPGVPIDYEKFEGLIDYQKFNMLKKEWSIWTGIESPKDEIWMPGLKHRISENLNSALGMVRWRSLTLAQVEVIKKAPWFTGLPLEIHPLIPSAFRSFYLELGWPIVVASQHLKSIDLSGVMFEDLDVLLGEALRQRGVKFVDIGDLVTN